MLADRSYMRSDYPRRNTSAVVWLIAALIAAYIMELVLLSPWFGSGAPTVSQFQLTVRSLQSGHVWTLLTHGFLHSARNPFHLLFTILGLVFFGRELETLLGARRFLAVYLGALVLGGLGWAAVHWNQGGVHMGASAGVLGIFVALAAIYPNQEISFPVLPAIRLKYIAGGLFVLEAFGLIFYELLGATAPFDYAPSAHLAGMLAGWIYFRVFHANNGWDRAASIEMPGWLRRRAPEAVATPPTPSPSAPRPVNLRVEVDRILDKINSDGFSALTEDEKRILDEAKDLLSRP